MSKRKTVQYFMFFPERFESSEILEELDGGFIDDWDYALVVDGGVETMYVLGPGARPTKWVAEGLGINGLGLKLMDEGDHSYDEAPEWKRLGK
jgi:hypothetical protein